MQGVIHTLAAALPAMAADASTAGGTNRRAVVLMGSTAGFASAAGLGAYCASKAALRSLAGSLRLETLALAPALTVHLACPGFADTALVRAGSLAGGPAAAALHAALVPPVLPAPASVADTVVAGVGAGLFLVPAGGPGAVALAAVARDPGGPGVEWVARLVGSGWWPSWSGASGGLAARAAAATACAASWAADVAAAPVLAAAARWFRRVLEAKTGAALSRVGLGPGVAPSSAHVRVGGGGGGGGNGASEDGSGAGGGRGRKVQ